MGTIIFLLIISGILLTVGLIVSKSFGTIQPDEIGIKVVLGKPGEIKKSGWFFALWPFVKMKRITKELMIFKFTVPGAITRKGRIEGYDKDIEPVEIDIKCAVYAQFDETKISHIIQYAPGYNAKAIGPFLVPYVMDTVRALAGRLPWRLINRERYKSSVWVQARLTGGNYFGIDDQPDQPIKFKEPVSGKVGESKITIKELEGKSPFRTLHMKNVGFVIEDLIFGEKLRDSIVAPEKAQLDAHATVIAAEASKTKKVNEGEGDATARQKMLEAIKLSPELEALSALKEIGKGQSNFIFSLPKFLEDALAKIGTGGKP